MLLLSPLTLAAGGVDVIVKGGAATPVPPVPLGCGTLGVFELPSSDPSLWEQR